MAILGTETEYGIFAPDAPDVSPVLLSERVVDAHAGPATPSLPPIYSRVLGNGARLYVDHGHPEYATPETTSPLAATVHELAGDRIVAEAAALASERWGTRIAVFKNNTDGKGRSYGYHENYLLSRGTDWALIEAVLPTFLVTRIVFTGAGRVGLGESGSEAGFQLSQRADFFERVSGLDTTRRRGLVNTRDEPHATPSRWRRLHVIAGDANRSPFATWLKLATASAMLAALEAGRVPALRLADPVAAFRAVSRSLHPSRCLLPLAEGGVATPLDFQRAFLDAAASTSDPEVLDEWAAVLDDLDDPASTADRLDWPAKLQLLEAARARGGFGWEHPRLAQLDLAWADLDDAASPFAMLRRAGRILDWVDGDAVSAALASPPDDTRAHARGRLVADHPDAVVAATWDSVLVRDARGGLHNLRMTEPESWRAGEYDPDAPWPGFASPR